MQKKRALLFGLAAILLLILDSEAAAEAAGKSLALCGKTLIPGLFPMFVLCAVTVPHLSEVRIGLLARVLGFPAGSEGIYLLGCAGGFPLGAACIAQGVEAGGLRPGDAGRMLGLCSFCGPGFLFGVIGARFSVAWALALLLIQLETAVVLGVLWPGPSKAQYCFSGQAPSLPEAVLRSVQSMLSVCAWVVLAGTAAGLLEKRLFPLLPDAAGTLLTGLVELTNGVFSLDGLPESRQFVLCSLFVCFGGISVLLQIAGLASQAGIGMKQCIAQKALQGLLGAALALGCIRFGGMVLAAVPILLLGKIAVEISGKVLYNGGRKEGI